MLGNKRKGGKLGKLGFGARNKKNEESKQNDSRSSQNSNSKSNLNSNASVGEQRNTSTKEIKINLEA